MRRAESEKDNVASMTGPEQSFFGPYQCPPEAFGAYQWAHWAPEADPWYTQPAAECPWCTELYSSHYSLSPWPLDFLAPPPGLEDVVLSPWSCGVLAPPPVVDNVDIVVVSKKSRNSRKPSSKEKIIDITWISEEEKIERLEEMSKNLESGAFNLLQNALEIVLKGNYALELRLFVQGAVYFLKRLCESSDPCDAVKVLEHTSQAHDMCIGDESLTKELLNASYKIRDILMVRTQLVSMPIGDRPKFIQKLREVHTRHLDDEAISHLMLSYRKTIWEKFIEAFDSKNDLIKTRCGKVREARARRQSQRARRRLQHPRTATAGPTSVIEANEL